MNAPGTRPIRLLLVDYQPSVRRGIKMRLALEEDLEVVGEVGDAAGAISLARALHPEVILMDIEMPGGIALTKALHTVAPRSAVVIFTLRDDAETHERAREAGAVAFVAKHQTEEALLAAIRRATAAHGKQRRHEHASARREEEYTDDMRDRPDK